MVSRQELYDLVWSTPMTKVAEEFKVSSSYLARVCASLNVPRPGRGYWAKLAVSAAPVRTALPTAQPGDQLSWEPGGELNPAAKHRSTSRGDSEMRSKSRSHWLVTTARTHFDNSRTVKDGDYLKPYKKALVDITVSKSCLEKAFRFASALFNALEAAGHRVVLGSRMHRIEIDGHEAPRKHSGQRYPGLWTPNGPTVVYVGDIPVGLAIIEMSEDVLMRYVNGSYIRDADYKPPRASRFQQDHSWTSTQSLPSGRLRLVAYCPNWRASWSATWQETAKTPLESSLRAILAAIEGSTEILTRKLAERQAEAERIRHQEAIERHYREEDRRRTAQAIKDGQEELAKIIWTGLM